MKTPEQIAEHVAWPAYHPERDSDDESIVLSPESFKAYLAAAAREARSETPTAAAEPTTLSPRLRPFLLVLQAAEGLAGEGEQGNQEYNRALVEVICDSARIGLTAEDRPTIAKLLGVQVDF